MHRHFKALVGAYLWCTAQSRPDLAFDVSVLSRRCQVPTVAYILEGNKALKQINRKTVRHRYPVMDEPMDRYVKLREI